VSDETNRLSRWSQRKLAARRGEAIPDEVPPVAGDVSPNQPVAALPETAADEPAPELPSIEELTAESDYKVFLQKGVPAALTRAALRKLWTSDPVLANLDGLNDYDEVYNAVQPALTLAQTSYRPGKGYADETEEAVDEPEEEMSTDEGSDRTESRDLAAAPDAEKGGDEALGESDAVGAEPGDASRQVAAAVPEAASADHTEDRDT
jgi:hypothetical protein